MCANETYENKLNFVLELGNQTVFIMRNIEHNAPIPNSVRSLEMVYYFIWRLC